MASRTSGIIEMNRSRSSPKAAKKVAPKPPAPKRVAPARAAPKRAAPARAAPKRAAAPTPPKSGSYALAQRNRIGGGTSSIFSLLGETVNTLLTPDQLRLVIGWAALVFLLFQIPSYD